MDALENYKSRSLVPIAGDFYLNASGGILANIAAQIQAKAAAAAPTVAATVALPDSALSQALVTWVTQAQPALVNSNPPLPYSQILSFFSNTANMPAIRAAMTNYGIQLVPLVSISGKVQYGAGTWVPYYRLYKAAYYYQTFPIPVADPANCTQIATMLPLIANEIASVKAQQAQGSINASIYTNTVFVLNDIQTTLTGMYGQMDCVDAEQQQQTAENVAETTAVTNAALSNPSGTTGIAGLFSNTLLYGIAGVMVIGALFVVFHKSAPAPAAAS